MTPTSALSGVLTGLVDGSLVGVAVLVVGFLAKRRQQGAVPVHPVAEDVPERRA